MSGIVGILNLDGRPVDPELLECMTASLDFRGPDAHEVWIDGAVGFGHTLLRTTYEAEHERQPLSFDRQTWIVADCRVDAREELVGKLRGKGRAAAALDRPDVELILHAWHVWGEACVEHLLGDYAFAIWDAQNRRLFCARDHMGVKLFYYAQRGATVVFSNTLDCVRLHPFVSDSLNDRAIADFLLFGLNQDKATTSFSDIKRLLPAHAISFDRKDFKTYEYWTIPIDDPIAHDGASRLDEEYLSLLKSSISDRSRGLDVGIFMSGGLDSSGICAVLSDLRSRDPRPVQIRAYTTSFSGHDDEERFARLTAVSRGVSIEIRDPLTEYKNNAPPRFGIETPEPCVNPFHLIDDREYYTEISKKTRVCMYGEGADNGLLYEPHAYASHLIKTRDVKRLAFLFRTEALNPKRCLRLAQAILQRGQGGPPPSNTGFPPYLNPDLVKALDLIERWQEVGERPASEHSVRPTAHASFNLPEWQALFEDLDPAFTQSPLEVRHPYVDIRMLRFMLRLPALPWCRNKFIARKALRGLLPDTVLNRPKSSIQGDPWLRKAERHGICDPAQHPALARYIGAEASILRGEGDTISARQHLRIRSLNHWLHAQDNLSFLVP